MILRETGRQPWIDRAEVIHDNLLTLKRDRLISENLMFEGLDIIKIKPSEMTAPQRARFDLLDKIIVEDFRPGTFADSWNQLKTEPPPEQAMPANIDPPRPEPAATGPRPKPEESILTATKVVMTPETKTTVSELHANLLLAGFALIPITVLFSGWAEAVFDQIIFAGLLLVWGGVCFWLIFTSFSGKGNRRKYAYGVIGLAYGIFGMWIASI